MLISPALELGGLDMNDYGVVQWVDVLPTMAGAAAHHGRGRALPAGTSLDEVRAAAEEFAAGDYAKFLVLGASLDAAERERILSRLADFLGLPVEFVTRAEGRVSQEVFARELLRDERKVVGFYDATITTTDPFPDRTGHEAPDATLAGIGAAYTAAINKQLRSEIGVETDRDYRLLSHRGEPGVEGGHEEALLRAAGRRDRQLPLRHGAQPAHAARSSRTAASTWSRRTTRPTASGISCGSTPRPRAG